MKIRPRGAEPFHADGQTDRQPDTPDMLKFAFPQFCERA